MFLNLSRKIFGTKKVSESISFRFWISSHTGYADADADDAEHMSIWSDTDADAEKMSRWADVNADVDADGAEHMSMWADTDADDCWEKFPKNPVVFFCTLPYDSLLMHVKYVSHLRVWPEMDKYLIAKCTQALSKTCPQHVWDIYMKHFYETFIWNGQVPNC